MVRDMVLVELMAVMGGKQGEVIVRWMALIIIAMNVEVIVVVLEGGEGGNDGSDCDIDIRSSSGGNVGGVMDFIALWMLESLWPRWGGIGNGGIDTGLGNDKHHIINMRILIKIMREIHM